MQQHTKKLPSPLGRIALNPAGAAWVILALPKSRTGDAVRARCADIAARAAEAPKGRKGAQGIAAFVVDLLVISGVELTK